MQETRVKKKCNVEKAAEILGKSEAAVYMDVQRRLLPFRKLGKHVYFFEEELFEFLDKQPGVRLEEAIAARD
jgi:hypothetical protein